MKQINLATFATSNWKQSPIRILEQAKNINKVVPLFSTIFRFNEITLTKEYIDNFKLYINDYAYGLYSWKPYVLLQVLDTLQYNDRLLYIDGGSSLPTTNLINFSKKIDEIFSNIEKNELQLGVGTYYNNGDKFNIRIVRKQILEKFNLLNNNQFLFDYPHFEAGALFIIKTEKTVNFINSWKQFMTVNYENIIRSDFYDKTGQHQLYIHNGSDQAVLQCMLYNYNTTHDAHFNVNTFFYDFNINTRIRG